MGRTAGQFCSRDSMFGSIATNTMPLIHGPEEPSSSAMTWQQKNTFGKAVKAHQRKSKAVHWQPLNLEGVQDPPQALIVNSDTHLAHQATIPIVSSHPQPGSNPHRGSSRRTSTAASLLDSANKDAQSSKKKPRKRYQRRKNSNVKDKTMGTLPQSAYIPPHLRKRATPAADTTNGKNENSIANGSTAASEKSKEGPLEKLHSSPNGASNLSSSHHSPPTTPREPEPAKIDARLNFRPSKTPQKEENEETAKERRDIDRAPEPEKVGTSYELTTVGAARWGGWDAPQPAPVPAAPKLENPRWPRNRGPHKKTLWPKQSEMRAMPSDSSSDGGITFKSNSNGDPDYDVKKLMDWNGDWLPPPEQWAARKSYTSRHLGQFIEQWINGHGVDCLNSMDIGSFSTGDGPCKEIVPKYWVVPTIEQDSTGEFWKKFVQRAPPSLSDVDIFADPPFWERFADPDSCFIEGLTVPDARVDPNDPDNYAAGADLLVSAEKRIERIMEQRFNAHRRHLAKQKRPLRETVTTAPQLPDRRIQPTTNIYIRPVHPADVRGIMEIYNYYVDNTIYANEFDSRTMQNMQGRINEVVEAGLPFLVAIAKGNQRKGQQGYVSERIVGYVQLDDYVDQSSMYRYTFEMELYVHPGFVCHKIAQCLLDRVLEMCNTGYNARGGYEYRNEYEYLKTGLSRVIKTIILNVHIENGEMDTKAYEYLKQFKFYRAGHLPEIGFKHGKVVDKFLFRHTTTENIDPNGRPSI